MGLSLNNIYQRPYVRQDENRYVKKRDDNEKSAAAGAHRERPTDENSRSKGLDYSEQKAPTYTPAYERSFSLPAANAYAGVDINAANSKKSSNVENSAIRAATGEIAEELVDNRINIAQILRDFRNTASAIGTPEDLSDIVNGYLNVVQKQSETGNADIKLVKSTLNNAAVILDNYISETLNKDSKVVENWVEALFLQKVDLSYNEGNVNERFSVRFDGGENAEQSENIREDGVPEAVAQSSEIPSSGKNIEAKMPEDKELKSLFVTAKRYAYANNPEQAIKSFERALNRALETGDTETSGKIYYEVGKIYDDHDYIDRALQSYNRSLNLTNDENVKTKAHYSMAKIYDDVNEITPAIEHYFSTISHAGEAENLPAQGASLTKLGNIYTSMYDKEAFDYYDAAESIASQTDNAKLKGFVAANTGKAHLKFEEPQKALKSFSNAAKNYADAESPLKTAQTYMAAADVMVEFNSLNKAYNLLTKAYKHASQTEDERLVGEIVSKMSSLKSQLEG